MIHQHLIDKSLEQHQSFLWGVKGQLTIHDRMLYSYLGEHFYSGKGVIVDAGALVGGTTLLLANGLSRNRVQDSYFEAIHVYDLFEDVHDGPMSSVIREWFDAEHLIEGNKFSWLSIFQDETSQYSDMLKVFPGDILDQPEYPKEDIEILSIDVAKTPDLMLGVARKFFPRLIPGESIVVHQDMIFAFQPWLAIFMEMLANYFEKIYETQSCSVVYKSIKKISEDDIAGIFGESGESYYHLNNIKFLYRAIDNAQSRFAKIKLTAALAFFYWEMNQVATGRLILQRAIEEYGITKQFIQSSEIERLTEEYYLNMDIASLF